MSGPRAGMALAGAVAMLMGSCGDGGMSTEEFLAEANGICQEHRSAIGEAAGELVADGQPPDPQEFGRLVQETIVPELSEQFQELGELEPPPDLSEDFDAYVAQGQRFLDRLRQDPSVLIDPASSAEVDQRANEVGLSQDCHVGPDAASGEPGTATP